MSIRSSNNTKRYEYAQFNPKTPLTIPGNGNYQTPKNLKFTIDNTSEETVFDWYAAYFEMDHYVTKMDNASIPASTRVGCVNGVSSLINTINVSFAGLNVVDAQNVDQSVNVKN